MINKNCGLRVYDIINHRMILDAAVYLLQDMTRQTNLPSLLISSRTFGMLLVPLSDLSNHKVFGLSPREESATAAGDTRVFAESFQSKKPCHHAHFVITKRTSVEYQLSLPRDPVQEREKRQAHGRALAAAARRQAALAAAAEAQEASEADHQLGWDLLKDMKY